MIEIVSAGLNNVVYYEEAHAQLNVNPLTFIRGVNLDSDPAKPTGNGTGKSLFFSILPTVAYASPPTSTKKKAKKEVLSKGSEMAVSLRAPNGSVYEVRQTATKYKIFKDGLDTQIRTTPLAEAEIRNTIFPLTEIEYYSHGYVSTLRPYLMMSDTDSNRLEHLSSIFRLEDYATLRTHFATKLRTLKDNEVRVSVLEQKLLTLKDKIAKVTKLVKLDSLVKYRKEHAALEASINVLVGQEFEALKTKQLLETLRTIEVELDDLRGQYSSKLAPKLYLAWLKDQKSLVKIMGEYQQLRKAHVKHTQSIQEKMDALAKPERSRKVLEKEKNRTEARIAELEPILEELQTQARTYRLAEKRVAPLVEDLKEYDSAEVASVSAKEDYNAEIESLKVSLRLKNLLEHDHLEGNSCPTCMSEVDLDNIRKVVAKAEKQLPALRRKLAVQKLKASVKVAKAELAGLRYDEEKLQETALLIEQLEPILEAINADLGTWRKISELAETLASIVAPAKPKIVPETELTYTQLDEQMDMCNAILQHVNARTRLLENNPDINDCRTAKSVAARISLTESKLSGYTEALVEQRERYATLSGLIEKQANFKAEHDLYLKELAEITNEIAEIKPDNDDKKVIETLIKAYSTKGLKTYAANLICSILQSNLNLYRPLIFVEPFTFSIFASETGLSIKVDRGNDKVSDVRNLSGAESDCFALLFLLSLLPLIPESRRLNMVTLDEPTAHCDDVPRQLFLDSYLPALCEVVPHVYVITNEPDDYVVGSNEWLVVKKDGVSRLVTNQ